jgi:putative flippase GtrA
MTAVLEAEGAAARTAAAGRSVVEGPMLAGPRLVALVSAILRQPGAGVLPQLSRYTVVSVVALGLDFVLFLALTHGGIAKAATAGVIGYSAGLVLHFVLSTRYVFNVANAGKSRTRLFAEFAASGVVGVLITWAVIALATDLAHLPAVIGKAGAVVASFAAVFVLRRTIVFAAHPSS